MYQPRSSSPTLSLRSNRSFLDSDPYPSQSASYPTPYNSNNHSNGIPTSTSITKLSALAHIENLLRAKAEEIALAGELGSSLLAQQAELEEKARELHEYLGSASLTRSGDTLSDTGSSANSLPQLLQSELRRSQRAASGGNLALASEGGADDSASDDEVGKDTLEKLAALEDDLRKWDEGNSALFKSVGAGAAVRSESSNTIHGIAGGRSIYGGGGNKSTTSLSQSLGSALPASPSAGGGDATPASNARRARNNAQHRTNDIELATEIGQSLLAEVRRLQALNVERDENIRDLRDERDQLIRLGEAELEKRKVVEENVEKYKEENWNLELVSQELRLQLTELQTQLTKSDSERQRATKDLFSTRDALEQQRAEADKLTLSLEALKLRHETDMANARKQAAGLQRDKSDLQGSLDGLKTELANRVGRVRRVGSLKSNLEDAEVEELAEDGEGDEEEDVFGGIPGSRSGRRKTGDGFHPSSPGDMFSDDGDSPNASPVQRAGETAPNEMASLRLVLAHAQRTIQSLKKSRRGNQGSWEDASEEGSSPAGTPERNLATTPLRNIRGSARGARGSARGRGSARRSVGLVLPGAGAGRSRLGNEWGDQDDSEEGETEDGDRSLESVPGGSIFQHQFIRNESPIDDDEEEEGERFSEYGDSPSNRLRDSVNNKRTSVQSVDMDPAFAHLVDADFVTRRSLDKRRPASIGSLASVESNRPTSAMFVDSPDQERKREATAELAQVAEVKPKIVWVDAITMTDFPLPRSPTPPPVLVAAPRPEVTDVGVQATPEPVPIPVVVPITTSEFGAQTDPIVVVDRKESSTETNQLITVDVATATEPDLEILAEPLKTAGIEVQIQTDSPAIPPSIALPAVSATLPLLSMEDRALASQPSFELLAPLSQPFADPDDTLNLGRPGAAVAGGTLAASILKGMDSDVESDRAGTETDGEFEDARESLVVSPVPTMTPSASIHDFQSVRSRKSHKTFQSIDSEMSDIEILRSPPRRKVNKVSSRTPLGETQEHSAAARLVAVTEVGVQTEDVTSQKVLLERPASGVPRHLAEWDPKRDSINTFGRPDPVDTDPIEESAAVAGAFLGYYGSSDRPLSPEEEEELRPESIASNFSLQTADDVSPPLSAVGKGKLPFSTPPSPPRIAAPARIPLRTAKGNTPRKSAVSMASSSSLRAIPPPRPSSPPPADLLHRAQSPVYDQEYDRRSTLLVPGTIRSQSSSMPPPPTPRGNSSSTLNVRTHSLRPQPSRSPSDYIPVTPTNGTRGKTPIRRGQHGAVASSGVSLSDISIHSDMSRRISIASSRTSEGGFEAPVRQAGDSTDPAVIHAITQTMIGEFLYKYTRRTIGKGISEKRHKRFFWVHPYTKTLYWSSADPGAQSTNQSSAKSVFIEGVREVIDPNPFPPGLYQGSIIVKTPNREMKITAGTRERHDMWFNAINYLLARPEVPASSVPATPGSGLSQDTPSRIRQRFQSVGDFNTPVGRNQKPMYKLASASDSRLTPRARGDPSSSSTFKRSGTAAEEYERRSMFGTPRSLRTLGDYISTEESIEIVSRSEIGGDFEAEDDGPSGWEGLENVRACCEGRHDVGSLSRHSHRHHHHSSDAEQTSANGDALPPRPRSSLSTASASLARRAGSLAGLTPRKSMTPSYQGRPLTPLANNGTIGRK